MRYVWEMTLSQPSSRPIRRRAEFLAGARDSLPMLLGAAPLGAIFGTLAAPSGLSRGGALAMSLCVFAGSSQFIALTLLAGGTGLVVILLTTLVVNLRHALYSATLLPHVAELPQRWRVPLAFWLTDETFAVMLRRYQARDGSPYKHWYYLGSGISMYVNWLVWTLAGLLLGRSLPRLESLGLEFAMAATFTGIVAPMLKHRPMLGAAVASGLTALAARGLPYQFGLLAAALAGVVAGLVLEQREAA
jgi:4-azaleucine resistance transporter AzlC